MASCTLDIKIGVDGTESKDLYKSIDVTIEMHQEKVINLLSSSLKSIRILPLFLEKLSLPSLLSNYQILR